MKSLAQIEKDLKDQLKKEGFASSEFDSIIQEDKVSDSQQEQLSLVKDFIQGQEKVNSEKEKRQDIEVNSGDNPFCFKMENKSSQGNESSQSMDFGGKKQSFDSFENSQRKLN